jgi:hypothetical protein
MLYERNVVWVVCRTEHSRVYGVCQTKRSSVLPSASLVLENIDFVYPFYVYDYNRPLAPKLRQRRLDDDGFEIPGIQSMIRTEYFSGEQ